MEAVLKKMRAAEEEIVLSKAESGGKKKRKTEAVVGEMDAGAEASLGKPKKKKRKVSLIYHLLLRNYPDGSPNTFLPSVAGIGHPPLRHLD